MINKTILQGRLTAEPELKKTSSDIAYCNFTVAWSEKYKETEVQCFMPCTAWRGTAEFVAKFFRKGQEIIVEGRNETRKWVDNDGNNRSMISLGVQNVSFCGPKAEHTTANNTPAAQDENVPFETPDTTELKPGEKLPWD